MAKDLVCGMEVDEKKAAAKSEYKGKTHYFCAPGCKKACGAQMPSHGRVDGGQSQVFISLTRPI
ncbi:MAG: YHS domain-containing protein [bacterium]